jgi:hypothetical protein
MQHSKIKETGDAPQIKEEEDATQQNQNRVQHSKIKEEEDATRGKKRKHIYI